MTLSSIEANTFSGLSAAGQPSSSSSSSSDSSPPLPDRRSAIDERGGGSVQVPDRNAPLEARVCEVDDTRSGDNTESESDSVPDTCACDKTDVVGGRVACCWACDGLVRLGIERWGEDILAWAWQQSAQRASSAPLAGMAEAPPRTFDSGSTKSEKNRVLLVKRGERRKCLLGKRPLVTQCPVW